MPKNITPEWEFQLSRIRSFSELSDKVLQEIDLVLVMSVEPGFGGQEFLSCSLEKIATLRERRQQLRANFVIQVDGGINQQTAPKVVRAGADNLVVGSYVFQGPPEKYQERIRALL